MKTTGKMSYVSRNRAKKRRTLKSKYKWFISNITLGAVVILLCGIIYIYEHYSLFAEDEPAIVAEPVNEEFLGEVNRFTFKTAYKLLENRKENLIYSPVSIYYTLSLLSCGAEGGTAKELNALLGMEDAKERADMTGRLYQMLHREDETTKLNIAASLWYDRKFSLRREFKSEAKKDFRASVHSVNFEKEEAGKQMGRWVEKQTNGIHQSLIQTNPNDVIHILNTIYFNDIWRNRLYARERKDAFYLADGKTLDTEYFGDEFDKYGFVRGDGFLRSCLYLNMADVFFVLPDEGVSVDTLFESEARLREVLEGGTEQVGNVNFKIPKFTLSSQVDIREMLEQQTGTHSLFTDGDFSKMADGDNFLISSIMQESHISVDEYGVEASALTSVIMMAAAIEEKAPEKVDMILNRPFLFGIKSGDVWLFIGVCDNPGMKEE